MTRLVAERWQSAFVRGLILQMALLILASLMLDSGYSLRVYCVSLVIQLFMTSVLIWRRPMEPTTFAVAFVKYGIVLVAVLGFILASVLGLHASTWWRQLPPKPSPSMHHRIHSANSAMPEKGSEKAPVKAGGE